MSRTKTGVVRRRWHKKLIKKAKGMWGTRGSLHRRTNEAMLKALWYAYRDRRARKRDLRRLWIVRINAAARMNGISYSKLMYGLKQAQVVIDRKMLADVAVRDPQTFTKIVAVALQHPVPTGSGAAVAAPAARVAAPSAVKASAPAPAATKSAKASKAEDDLTAIEGLGPKSAAALKKAGITTFAQIASMTGEELLDVVKVQGGVNVVGEATKTWPKQAKFLVDGDLEGFEKYKDYLVGGREPEDK